VRSGRARNEPPRRRERRAAQGGESVEAGADDNQRIMTSDSFLPIKPVIMQLSADPSESTSHTPETLGDNQSLLFSTTFRFFQIRVQKLQNEFLILPRQPLNTLKAQLKLRSRARLAAFMRALHLHAEQFRD
jgi:hypothetical protein